VDVKGKDNSKPGYISKNTLKYKASCQVINEVSDTKMVWRNYEGRGGRSYLTQLQTFVACFSLSSYQQI
jgi:hypothetical protein